MCFIRLGIELYLERCFWNNFRNVIRVLWILQDGTTLQLPVVDIDIANATKTQVGNVMLYENLLNCIIYHCYIINDI